MVVILGRSRNHVNGHRASNVKFKKELPGLEEKNFHWTSQKLFELCFTVGIGHEV